MTTAKILVVEDEGIVAKDIEDRLTGMGYLVVGITAYGEEAVQLAGDLKPDLVLMDIRLKGEPDGVAAADRIRFDHHLPVVYVTAYADEDTLQRARVTEPFGYVLKPFEDRELRTVIEIALYKHEADRRLRESQARYAATLQSIGDAVLATDDKECVTLMNQVAEALTGWPRSEAIGQAAEQVFRIIHEQTREAVENPVAKALREKVVVDLPDYTILVARDGRESPIDDSAAPIQDERGQCTGVVLVFRDARERRLAEQQLQLREQVVASCSQGIAILDAHQPGCPIIYANQALAAITGYAEAELLGKELTLLYGPATDADAIESIHRALRETATLTLEVLLHCKDGKPYWGALSLSPIRNGARQLTHFVLLLADISERKRIEARLRQAQKMEAIGRIAGGIAHDFNNLLTITNGYSQLLLNLLDPQHPQRQFVEEILKAGNRAAQLVHQLLAFSSKQVLQPGVIDLNQTITAMTPMLRRLLGDAIELHAELAPELRRVKADLAQLEQVILNLAINARDAMPRGGQLTLQTANLELDAAFAQAHAEITPGRHVRLSVTDTGLGMDEPTKARVFEPFFTTKELGKGSGLGLATVYGIIRQSGGLVTLASQPGQGTSFQIYLPALEESARPSQPDLAGLAQAPRGTETVLLVEDDDAVRGLDRQILEMSGYRVLEARNGPEALQISAGHAEPIPILVTDVIMPLMTGNEVAERLLAQRPDLKVLFISGYPEEAVARQAEAGAAFLQKPFSPESLAAKVRQLLDQ